jgi:4-amino-4-deoxy-L-arabinose transferase-like glycosyltransferase
MKCRLTRSHRLIVCAALAGILYLPGLGRPALWEPDEGRYAEIAREMALTSDYVTPRNDWVPYLEKPPLVYWMTAGSIRLFGPNEFAGRLQAAIATIGEVVVTAALGEKMFGPAAGILAALALALSPLCLGFARFATPDPALAFCLTAALAAFYHAARAPTFGTGPGRPRLLIAAAMLALGTLAKGLVALVLGGGIALTWLVIERRARDARKIPWLSCAVVYLAISVPWFVMAARRNPGFLRFFFFHEHLQRYLENTEHGWGPWFFIPIVAAGFWPWLFFMPAGVAEIWPDMNDDEARRKRSATSFLLVWFGLIFVFFSIPRSKLGEYILPGLPPLAIIAGNGFLRLGDPSAGRARRHLLWFVIVNAIVATAIGIAGAMAIHRGFDPALITDGFAAAVALLAGAAAAYAIARAGRSLAATVFPIALGVVLASTAAMKAREEAAPMVSYRMLARTISPLTAGGCVLASYRHYIQALPFYTGVREKAVAYRGELAPFGASPDALESFITTDAQLSSLWGSSACVVMVANRQDLRALMRLLTPTPSIVGCEGKKFALSNRPASAHAQLPPECRIEAPTSATSPASYNGAWFNSEPSIDFTGYGAGSWVGCGNSRDSRSAMRRVRGYSSGPRTAILCPGAFRRSRLRNPGRAR